MCSRYELLTNFECIVAGAALKVSPDNAQARGFRPKPKGEIRPTDPAPVILPGGALAVLPWGLAVDWQPQPVINARSETLEQKPTFKPLLEQRCLVAATGYFEWRKHGREKIKTRIKTSDNDVFFFAGLIGAERFTIVTCAPNPSIAYIHDRMPVIVPNEAHALWLDTARRFGDVKHLLVPFAGRLAVEEETPPPQKQGELAL